MKSKRNDLKRLLEIVFLEEVKSLNEVGVEKYRNNPILEYLNPGLSYVYEESDFGSKGKMWSVKQEDDFNFLITLKYSEINKFFVLDFYFPENEEKRFERIKSLKGKHYLDTLCKVFIDEIIPYFEKQNKINSIYFNAYSEDGAGNLRKKVFNKILDKFLDKNLFNIKVEGLNFLINKNEK